MKRSGIADLPLHGGRVPAVAGRTADYAQGPVSLTAESRLNRTLNELVEPGCEARAIEVRRSPPVSEKLNAYQRRV